MGRAAKICVAVFSLGAGLLIAGLVFGILVFYFFGRDLPDYTKLSRYVPAGTTRLYAADGRMAAEYATQKRIPMPLDRMPRRLIQAFIAAEDKNFYHHTGIDATGIVRAAWENIRNIGEQRSLVGGSTITQQVVKNFLLTREKSLSRKVKEALVAYRITRHYSKDKILELYLNEIYLGIGAYGVAAAAEEYFDKPLEALKTEEIALLAAMPKAPALYDPRRNAAAALARRNYVIDRMLEDGYINEAEAEHAQRQSITLRARARSTVHAEYFAEEVRRHLMKTYGREQVYAGGLFVKTTLVPAHQELADRALRNALIAYDLRHGYRGALGTLELGNGKEWQAALEEFDKKKRPPVYDDHRLALVLEVQERQAKIGFLNGKTALLPFSSMQWARRVIRTGSMGTLPARVSDVVKPGDAILLRPRHGGGKVKDWQLIQVPEVNGGLVIMDAKTGAVLALSGGYDPRNDQFNRVTQAKRQPGSAFKPFVYLSAMERGFTPSTIVVDAPVEISQGPGLPMWRPKNYEGKYLGPATLRIGLEKSRNLMTVRLAQMLGIHRIALVGKRFGIYSGEIPENYSMVLGSVETTLIRLAAAYSVIANGGMKVTPQLVERVDDRSGKTLYRSNTGSCAACAATTPTQEFTSYAPPTLEDTRERILDPRVAYQMISMLRGVVQRGTAVAANRLGRPLAGKTGTTNDSRDTWFIGFSPDLVVGVFVGHDQPRNLGQKETGGRVALPAFIEVMEHLTKDQPIKAFYVPSGIQEVMVDYYSGMAPVATYETGGYGNEYGYGEYGSETPYPPPAPVVHSGRMIAEAFVYGGPVFIPEKELQELEARGEEQEDRDTIHEVQSDTGYVFDPDLAEPQQILPERMVPGAQPPVYADPYRTSSPAVRYEEQRRPTNPRRQKRFGPADMGTGALY
jgi:penicillin-binding protein 1A